MENLLIAWNNKTEYFTIDKDTDLSEIETAKLIRANNISDIHISNFPEKDSLKFIKSHIEIELKKRN